MKLGKKASDICAVLSETYGIHLWEYQFLRHKGLHNDSNKELCRNHKWRKCLTLPNTQPRLLFGNIEAVIW